MRRKRQPLNKFRSSESTDADSSFEGHPLVNTKVKTELCNTFSLIGSCTYGQHCRFAHGRTDLMARPDQSRRKHRQCNSFWKKGLCGYGTRCQFRHTVVDWETKAVLRGLASCTDSHYESRLLLLLS